MACWYDSVWERLGDWGATLWDHRTRFLDWASSNIQPTTQRDTTCSFYPMSTYLWNFKFPNVAKMHSNDNYMAGGHMDHNPSVPDGYGISELDSNYPTTKQRADTACKLNPGKIIYSERIDFQGRFTLAGTLSIYSHGKSERMESKLPVASWSPFQPLSQNFWKLVKGEEKNKITILRSQVRSVSIFVLGAYGTAEWDQLELDRKLARSRITLSLPKCWQECQEGMGRGYYRPYRDRIGRMDCLVISSAFYCVVCLPPPGNSPITWQLFNLTSFSNRFQSLQKAAGADKFTIYIQGCGLNINWGFWTERVFKLSAAAFLQMFLSP